MIRTAPARLAAICATAMALAPANTTAQTLSPNEADILPRVIDTACVDMIEDRLGCELAVLVSSTTQPDRADLVLLSDRRSETPGQPLLVARNIAFSGAMFGMAPELDGTESGSLRLVSQQFGIGRFPWFQTLTIAYRDNRFVLAGFTYRTLDRSLGGGMSCDVNLLTGDYVVEATAMEDDRSREVIILSDTGRIEAMDLDVANIGTNTPFPAPCEAGIAAMDGY